MGRTVHELVRYANLERMTNRLDELPGRRCSIAGALAVVGDRWALLVVREVSLGAHRFSEMLRGTGAPREQLTARLNALVDAGVEILKIHLQVGEFHLDDPLLDGVWGVLEEARVPVVVHAGSGR